MKKYNLACSLLLGAFLITSPSFALEVNSSRSTTGVFQVAAQQFNCQKVFADCAGKWLPKCTKKEIKNGWCDPTKRLKELAYCSQQRTNCKAQNKQNGYPE